MKTKLFLTLSLVVAFAFLVQGVDKPFIGLHDWNGVQYGNMARNYVRYGLQTTKLGQIENAGIVDPDNFAINTHYPATFPLLLATSFKIFGVNEWSARLLPIIFSLALVLITFQLSEMIIGKNTGIIASLFLISTPMFRYFAKMPVHEPLITAAVLWVVISYLKWRQERASWYWLLISVVFAQSLGWPGYYITPILFFYDWMLTKKPALKSFLPLFLAGFLLFGLHLLHNLILVGDPFGGGLLEVLKLRLDIVSSNMGTVITTPLSKFIKQETVWTMVYFTTIQSILTLLALIFLAAKKELRSSKGIIIVLLIYGMTHAVIFRHAALIHEYLIFYLAPGIALAATLALRNINQLLRQKFKVAKNRNLTLLATIIFLGASFIERDAFTRALEATSMHKIGKEVGEEVASLTQATDVIYAHSLPYAMIYSKFTAFYSDRNISHFDKNKTSTPKQADVEVIIKEYPPVQFDPIGYEELDYIYIRKLQ